MQSGRYSSPTFLYTHTRVSCRIITLNSSLKITLFHYASTVLWRLPLHQDKRFFLFTARILMAFFTVRLWYQSSWSFLWIVRFEKVRFLPVLNKSVISSKDFIQCRLAVRESSFASLTPNSFGHPDRCKFSLFPRWEYRWRKLYTVLCFKPDILTMSVFFYICIKKSKYVCFLIVSQLLPLSTHLCLVGFSQILKTIIIWRISWRIESRDNCLNSSGISNYNRRIIDFILKYEFKVGFVYIGGFDLFTNNFGGWL